MFYSCKDLEELSNLSKWKTNNIVNMRMVFSFLFLNKAIIRYFKLEHK